MSIHIENRKKILNSLKEEIVGPSPQGSKIDCSVEICLPTVEEFYRPYRQSDTGDEILQRDPPCTRYGVGVLYPLGSVLDDTGTQVSGENTDVMPESRESNNAEMELGVNAFELDEIMSHATTQQGEPENDDLDISSANRYRPSSMGMSFLVELPSGSRLEIEATGGRYEPKEVSYGSSERTIRTWWIRRQVQIKALFLEDALQTHKSCKVKSQNIEVSGNGLIDLRIEVFSRPQLNSNHKLITVCLINRSNQSSSANEYSLFQSHLQVQVISQDGSCHILPYPGSPHEKMDEEEQSLSLLYRDCETFAIGHGCAADWKRPLGSSKAQYVTAESLPCIEVPSMFADVCRPDGSVLEISMRNLAGLNPEDTGLSEMKELIDSYERWISAQNAAIGTLQEKHLNAARRNINLCKQCIDRMKKGLLFLMSDDLAKKAFQLANHAILLQQIRASRSTRCASYNSQHRKIKFSDPFPKVNIDQIPNDKGYWRAFQLAFILVSISSTVDGDDCDREMVELIWFPTGGGKTEAYLGLAAFSIFMKRLRDRDDTGVHVIMRYTLRLLTIQQFQRASVLICAMEFLRKSQEQNLGETPFSIGVWLGSASTPNSRIVAKRALQEINRQGLSAQNPFVITKCPWCSAEMGPVAARMPNNLKVIGYERSDDTVIFRCSDTECHFSSSLPIYVIDEDIYEKRPTLIIGTVDKFATLAWRTEPRALFGISVDGNRFSSPPNLIIQDELHLISGPLGSMVGLYELILEELCTDKRNGIVRPKIVSSTATIRRYAEQIRSLYGRSKVALFPQPGLSAGDSFFSAYARDTVSGELLPGKLYVGIHAPGLGSMQTLQVRTFSALLQSPMVLPEKERDPWWTLLLFFNSLRELGTTLSLFQSDIPIRLGVIQNRMGLARDGIRRVKRELELTSRLRNDEVPRAIEELEKTYETGPVDTCLSSSIIEVGIDIDRLSLMAIVGQPKSTSQYIQVSGRVGRKWRERPGLVVTLYGASKPRDRSHFEQFRSYHERLYAQVEPTSVTPFSRPALERALHGVMVSYVRQTGRWQDSNSPFPAPERLLGAFETLLMERAEIVDPNEIKTVQQVFQKRLKQWQKWQRTEWTGSPDSENPPLLVRAGSYVPQIWKHLTWETPNSMRNVDAECRIAITKLYLQSELDVL